MTSEEPTAPPCVTTAETPVSPIAGEPVVVSTSPGLPDVPIQPDTMSIPECEAYERSKDKGYSKRRAWYIGLVTVWCLVVPVVFVMTGHETELAKMVATSLIGLAGTVCAFYLGAGVLDRSKFLDKMGDGFGNRGGWHKEEDRR